MLSPVGLDWRLSATTNARRVLTIINKVITLTGTDRVDILAHSQGGLVAEAIAHDNASAGKIYRIVTLGTPYLGAPKMLSRAPLQSRASSRTPMPLGCSQAA